MVRIAIARADGGVSIMQLVAHEATDEAIEAEIARVPSLVNHTSWHRVTEDELPADRYFRNALVVTDGRITVDMTRARAIHRDKLRAARTPLMEALDVAYQRADETGDQAAKAAIATEKQALRDVTADSAIDAAATPAELKAVWPDVLVGARR